MIQVFDTEEKCIKHLSALLWLDGTVHIESVKWCDFIGEKENYLQIAEEIKGKIDDYVIAKTVG